MVYREFKLPETNPEPRETDRVGSDTPQTKTSKAWNAALTIGAVAGTAAFAWGMNRLLSLDAGPSDPMHDNDSERKKKMMKAPGRNGEEIERNKFVRNAKGYFDKLHEDEKREKLKKRMEHLSG